VPKPIFEKFEALYVMPNSTYAYDEEVLPQARKKQHRWKKDDPDIGLRILTITQVRRNLCTITQVRRNLCTITQVRRNLCKITQVRGKLCTITSEKASDGTATALHYRCWLPQSTKGQVSICQTFGHEWKE